MINECSKIYMNVGLGYIKCIYRTHLTGNGQTQGCRSRRGCWYFIDVMVLLLQYYGTIMVLQVVHFLPSVIAVINDLVKYTSFFLHRTGISLLQKLYYS